MTDCKWLAQVLYNCVLYDPAITWILIALREVDQLAILFLAMNIQCL